MAFAVVNLGIVTNATGASLVSPSLAAVPAGSIIVVIIGEASNVAAPAGNVADNAGVGNTYLPIAGVSCNNVQANGFIQAFYAENASMAVGKVITYTRAVSGANAAMSIFYITGGATSGSLDTAATATGFGNGNAPTVTSGTPVNANNIAIGVTGANGAIGVFNQMAGWTTPPTAVTGTIRVGGGNKVTSGSGTTAYSPTYGAVTIPWGALIFEFSAPSGVTASAAWTEAQDALAASGSISTIGAAAWTEAQDIFAASGTVTAPGITASAAWTEAQDALAASGTVSLPAITASAAWTETQDRLAASGGPPIVVIDIDGHDPGEKKRKRQWDDERERRELRRAQLLDAFERLVEGKPEISDEVADEIVAVAEAKEAARPDVAFDFEALIARADKVQALWNDYLERDDEDVLNLL